MAHMDAVSFPELQKPLEGDEVRLARSDADLIVGLPYGHVNMVDRAVERLRQDYAGSPNSAGLLEQPSPVEGASGPTRGDRRRASDARHIFPAPNGAAAIGTGLMSDGTRRRPSRLWQRGEH